MPRKGTRKPKTLPGDPNDPHGFRVLIDSYLEWLRARNYSEATVHNRGHYLKDLLVWCAERSLSRPREVTRPVLERYQRWLFHYRKKNGEPLSFRGQHSRLIPVRAFFKWLCRQNLILHNPASELELPRLEKRLPKHILTAREAEAVLTLPDLKTPTGLRDRAMLETLYSTGMRRMELIGLKLYDLDTDRAPS